MNIVMSEVYLGEKVWRELLNLQIPFPKKKFHVFGDVKTIDRSLNKNQINGLKNLYMHNF